jgi:ubiquinol-cytochrome c reductase cytochrome b subunit
VFAKLSDWLDHRTGFRRIMSVMLIEHIPGGAKWRYVWGSCLAFVFMLQLVTGVLLMTAYSPSSSTAWASVHYIQYEMDFGWLIRGLHHFGSQTMVVLLALHMLQVVIAGAHLPPREINWWLGLILMGLVLGLSLTGYLLPWDQKGYWATQVATNIAGNLPGAGEFAQKIIVGGPEYGHHTLTRFFALHVAILPGLLIFFLVLHVAIFRRHGITTPKNAQGEGWFWPDQAFRDLIVCLLIFGVMLYLVISGHGHKIEPVSEQAAAERSLYDKVAHAGLDGRGANLDAPADPGTESYPARPEWYFLFLFQLLKYFKGEQEILGTVVIPNGALVLLAILPLLGYGRMRKFGHAFGVLVVCALLGGVGALTYFALAEDRADTKKGEDFRKDVKKADALGHRAVTLARDGIPAEGGINLLRRDPVTQGPRVFRENCAGCHSYKDVTEKGTFKAAELSGFGTEDWVYRLLVKPGHEDFFGRTERGTMQEWIESNMPHVGLGPDEIAGLSEDEKKILEQDRKDLRTLARWLSRHPRPDMQEKTESWYTEGVEVFENRDCATCHKYDGKGGSRGPDLTGYGDADWLRTMIMKPYHKSRYGDTNTMPGFRDLEGPTATVSRQDLEDSRQAALAAVTGMTARDEKRREAIKAAHNLQHLSDVDRELLIRWLLKDDRVIFGGDPISGPPKR